MKKIIFVVWFTLGVFNAYSFEKEQKDITLEKLINEIKERYEYFLNLPTTKPSFEKDLKNIEYDARYYLKVTARNKYERTRLLELGLDIISISTSYVEGIIHSDLLGNITEKEFTIIDKKTLLQWISEKKDFPPQDAAYHNYRETYDVLKSIVEKNSDISYLFSIGKSYEGREIWGIRINSTDKGLDISKKPGIVFVGNHHAREHLTNEMALLFAVYLLENRNNPDVKKYIDKLDIYIIPMLNPDGVEYDIATGKYRWWRKNTNKLGGNSIVGVDLNRNYDFEWCKAGASSYQYSDTYCGKSPFSEPETKALRDFLTPRRNIKIMMSYHSYGSLVLYPWGGRDEPVSDEKDRKAFIKHAQEMAKILGYTAQQSNELYIATGDACDWAYDKLKILAFTIELEGKSFYPGASIIDKAFERNRKAAMYLLSVTENPYQ